MTPSNPTIAAKQSYLMERLAELGLVTMPAKAVSSTGIEREGK
jgi:hypothetical protein